MKRAEYIVQTFTVNFGEVGGGHWDSGRPFDSYDAAVEWARSQTRRNRDTRVMRVEVVLMADDPTQESR